MTGLARVVIDMLLTPEMREQAAAAMSVRGLGDACDPAAFTGFLSWPTAGGTCTLLHSPASMILIAENRRESARLVGVAPFDAKTITSRDWSVFAPVALAA